MYYKLILKNVITKLLKPLLAEKSFKNFIKLDLKKFNYKNKQFNKTISIVVLIHRRERQMSKKTSRFVLFTEKRSIWIN